MKTLAQIRSRHKYLVSQKAPWIPLYNAVAKYLQMRKDFYGLSEQSPGSFVPADIYDTTAVKNKQLAASALVGCLWPDGPRSFEIVPAEDFDEKDNQEVIDYLSKVTDRMRYYMAHAKSGFAVAHGEFAEDQFSFGTTGFAVMGNSENWPVVYRCWDVKEMVIDENAEGAVDTIYRTRNMTIRRAMEEYGAENFSATVQGRIAGGALDDNICIVHCICPRYGKGERIPEGKEGVLFMPFASIHYEESTGKIIEEGGFEEFPVPVCRLIKLAGWTYGWSSALAALPDIIELNAFWEAMSEAAEKGVRPPMGVYNDSVVNGTLNTGSDEVTVFQVDGRQGNQLPVFPIQSVGDFRGLREVIEAKTEAVKTNFFVDRLMDFNNEARMTAAEVAARGDLRYKSLGAIFGRQESEMLVPVIERTHNILFTKGLLGIGVDTQEALEKESMSLKYWRIPQVIVEAILNGQSYFQIVFRNSVTAMKNSEEVGGIITLAQTTGSLAQIDPQVLDKLHVDNMVGRLRKLLGTHPSLERAQKEVEAIRANRQQVQAQMAQTEQREKGAKAEQSLAQARAMDAKSGPAVSGFPIGGM